MRLPSLHNLSIGAPFPLRELPKDVTVVIFKTMIANGLEWDQLLALKEVNPSLFYSSREFFDYCKEQDPGASIEIQRQHFEYCCDVSEKKNNEVLRAVVALHLRTYIDPSNVMLRLSLTKKRVPRILEAAQCTWMTKSVTLAVMDESFLKVKFNVHDTSTVVPQSEFQRCTWLFEDALPDSIEEIGEEAFSECDELELKSLPPNLKIVGDNAFSHCAALDINNIPSTVTGLGKYAFSFCTSITEMTLPNSLSVLPEGCFYYCNALEKVRLPNKLTNIKDSAFCRCENLNTIEGGLPESLVYIGASAFEKCPKLSLSVRGVIKRGDYAFDGCPLVTIL